MSRKRCTKCKKIKAAEEFPMCKHPSCVSGFFISGSCKACHSKRSLDYYHKHMKDPKFKKKQRDRQRVYNEDPEFKARACEYQKKKRLEDPKVREAERRRARENRVHIYQRRREREKADPCLYAKRISRNEERRARLMGAKIPKGLPPVDKGAIVEMIAFRLRLNKKAGYKKFCVDHIIPICRGGFQHQDNLRVITTKNNAGLGGKFDKLDSEWGKVPYCHYRREYYTFST